MAFVAKELAEDDVTAIRDFKGGIKVGMKQFGISEKRYRKIREAATFEEAVAIAQGKAKSSGGDDGHRTEVPLSDIKVKGAPVRFRLKDEEITLLADDLLTCYFIYLDMKRKLGLSDSFSEALTIGMKTAWSLTQIPVVNEGGEVKNG